MGPCFPGKSSDACIWKNAVQCRILFNRALSGNCKIFFWSHHSYACPNQQISVSRHKRPIMPCFECLGIDLTNCSQYVFFSPFPSCSSPNNYSPGTIFTCFYPTQAWYVWSATSAVTAGFTGVCVFCISIIIKFWAINQWKASYCYHRAQYFCSDLQYWY